MPDKESKGLASGTCSGQMNFALFDSVTFRALGVLPWWLVALSSESLDSWVPSIASWAE